MNRYKIFSIFFIVHLFILTTQKLYPQSFYFLTLRPGIKANAMGGAQAALVNDYQSFYYNPAGLARIKKGCLGFSNTHYNFLGYENKLNFGSVAYRMNKLGVFGFALYSFTNEISENQTIYQNSFQLSFGKTVSNNIHFGISIKYLRQNYFSKKSHLFSGDIGLLLENILPVSTIKLLLPEFTKRFNRYQKKDFKGISLSISLLNTGPGKTIYPASVTEPISQILNLGIGYKLLESDLFSVTSAFDFNKNLVKIKDGKEDHFLKAWFSSWKDRGFDGLHAGCDFNLFYLFSIYLGYEKFYSLESDYKDDFTFGFSIGPDYAHIEAFYRAYPTYLPEPDRKKIWRFGFSIAY